MMSPECVSESLRVSESQIHHLLDDYSNSAVVQLVQWFSGSVARYRSRYVVDTLNKVMMSLR